MSLKFVFTIMVIVFLYIIIKQLIRKRKIESIVGKHVLITGGSKGLGSRLAIECAIQGANVTIIARDEDMLLGAMKRLQKNRKTIEQKFQYACLDVSSSYEKVAKVLAECEKSFGNIYCLINCAGFGICGKFDEIALEDVHKLMNTNYFGTYYCTRYALTKMKRAKEGIIVVTAAQSALQGIYAQSAYVATKYALRGMAESLDMEARKFNISVTLALPPDMHTQGFVNKEETQPKELDYRYERGTLVKPQIIAKNILKDALCGNFISIYGLESWLMTIMGGGLLRWNSFLQIFGHAFILGPLRLITSIDYFYHVNITKILADKIRIVSNKFQKNT